MSNINQIELNGTTYDLEDTTATDLVNAINEVRYDSVKSTDELKSCFDALDLETQNVTITPTANVGYRWAFATAELVEHSSMTAWEFNANSSTHYILQGLSVGTSQTASVIFLDSNDAIISQIYTATQETGHKLPIVTPPLCVKVKYSTNTNATWDAYPVKVSYKTLANQPPVKANADAIAELKGTYPSYYDDSDYLADKIAEIINNMPLNGVSFAFITDLHFASNQLISLSLLKTLQKTTPINVILSGGDYVQAYGDEDDIKYAYSMLLKYAKELYPNWFSIRGNHDFTIKTSSDTSTGITWDDAVTHSGIIKSMADWRYDVIVPAVSFLNSTYNIYANYCWVLTNEAQKFKILYVADFNATNTSTYWGVTGSLINAYCNYMAQMLKTTDGYTFVVVTHAPLTPLLDEGLNNHMKDVIEAFVNRQSITLGAYTNDFSQCTGILACAISGHTHKDQSVLSNGVLHINTTCDACYNDDPNVTRTANTITEQAFDVFNIDTVNRTIKITRIGAGSDRTFSY